MIIHFLFAFICSIIFALILTYIFKRRAPGPFNGVAYFFAIIFLFTAALGILLTPMGPMYKNVPWLSIASVGLLIMLLIAELLPHHEKAVLVKREKLTDEEADEHTLEKEFSIIIIIILVALAAAIVYALTSSPDKFRMSF